jgi:hypothetical protein
MYYKNGTIYNSQQAIRNDNKDTSLPVFMTDELIESLGYLKIVDGVKPIPSAVQYVVEDSVTLVNSVPTRNYKLVDMFADTPEYTDMDGIVISAKTKLENETAYIAKQQADSVPKVITPLQARLALSQLGLRQQVEDSMLTSSQDVKDFYEFALEWRRDNAQLLSMATSLGMDSAVIDNFFLLASTL